MDRLTIAAWAVLGLIVLVIHMASVAVTRALRTYSRSRLEEACEARGRPGRAELIVRKDEATERAAEALAILSGLSLAAMFGATIGRLAPGFAEESVGAIALTVGALGHVVAGLFGRVHAEGILDAAWPAASTLRGAMLPFTATSKALETLAYRRWRPSAPPFRPPSIEVEIHSTDASGSGADEEAELDDSTRTILERVVGLSRRDVSEIMTPRVSIRMIPASSTPDEAARVVVETGFSRIPVFGENRDDVVGILYTKDLLARISGLSQSPTTTVRKLARPALKIPETMNAQRLLDDFLAKRIQIAIAHDEYGGVSGLVTLEDILEQLVGEIDDEHDRPADRESILSLGDSRYEVDASVPIGEINDRLDLRLPTDSDYSTLAGLALESLARLPEPGATFRRDGVEFTVIEVIEHSIRRMRIDLRPAAPLAGKVAG